LVFIRAEAEKPSRQCNENRRQVSFNSVFICAFRVQANAKMRLFLVFPFLYGGFGKNISFDGAEIVGER
jgi:hypothetical protein